MKNIYSILLAFFLAVLILYPTDKVTAGNKDRSGQAGASELLINPWARSSAWGGVGTSCTQGLEALFTNIAGTAFTTGTEIAFSYTNWLQGSGVKYLLVWSEPEIGKKQRGTHGCSDVNELW